MTEVQRKANQVREKTKKAKNQWIKDLTACMRSTTLNWMWEYGTFVQWSDNVPPPPAEDAAPMDVGPRPKEPPPPLPASVRSGPAGSSPDQDSEAQATANGAATGKSALFLSGQRAPRPEDPPPTLPQKKVGRLGPMGGAKQLMRMADDMCSRPTQERVRPRQHGADVSMGRLATKSK